MYKFFNFYYNQYYTLIIKYWNRMTPAEYFAILILIAVAGWFMMRSANKK